MEAQRTYRSECCADYIAQENSEAARKVVSEIYKQTQVLSIHPKIGRRGRALDTYELVIARYPYIVAYEIAGESLDIPGSCTHVEVMARKILTTCTVGLRYANPTYEVPLICSSYYFSMPNYN